ncbi:Putative Histidine kinase (fragment) [Planktothrix sp. PCC 11201]|uniref:response regulator n=1 Tax=Planktothrix sp. PCC 11201 TaxID=1729650 RepID=UPI0009139B73
MSIFNEEQTANILVVDDTVDNLRLLDTFLSGCGYNVRLSRDGNFAIRSALEDPPDLILLDIMMPPPDGYEICSQLKAHEQTRNIPIIFISAKDQLSDKVQAFSVGGNDYITKPFELEEVEIRVKNQLKISRLSQILSQQNSLLKAENKIQERIRSSLNLEDILTTAVEEVREFLSVDRVLIYQILPNGNRSAITESVEPGWPSIKGQVFPEEIFIGEFQYYDYQEKFLLIEDINQVTMTPALENILRQLKVQAKLLVPIVKDSSLWGFLIAHNCRGPRKWLHSEIESIRHISIQLAIAVQQSTLFEQAKAEIIERKKAEAALKKAVNAADIANRAKSEFLANMSHELRTPLNAILGFAQLMNHDLSLKPDYQRYVEIINRAGSHLLELINDILEMSKIEAGRVTLNKTDFNLISFLNNLQNILQIQALKKGLNLVFEIPPNIPQFVQTDEGKLRQVLINILGNALKFTQMGSVTLRAKLKPENQADQSVIIFEIEDTGLGISSEEISHLFQAFAQTETGRKYHEGTGLGLAISRKFIQLMGGDITVQSVVNQGTIFTFEILVQRVESPILHSSVFHPPILRLAPQQPSCKILAVDDVLESRLLLSEILNGVGFQVKEAENGLQAVELFQIWKPDLIFMDMRMPVMNGLKATQMIKADLLTHKTLIIALTASAFEEDRAMLLAAGCDDFIRKPFQREDLLEKVKQHLQVEYIYQKGKNRELENLEKSETLPTEDIKLHLAKMPPKWVEQLHEYASQCSDNGIMVLLQQIPPENVALTQALTSLVDNFQFDKILALLVIDK